MRAAPICNHHHSSVTGERARDESGGTWPRPATGHTRQLSPGSGTCAWGCACFTCFSTREHRHRAPRRRAALSISVIARGGDARPTNINGKRERGACWPASALASCRALAG
eukprot:3250600-Prymnesium_polylepis.2